MWKERNSRVFEGNEREMGNIRDRWIQVFVSMLLGHDINSMEDFGNVVDHLIVL